MTPVPGEPPRLPPRGTRGLPPPEHNLIQNPAVTRGLQRFTGLRQSHVAPALSDGMQPSLLVGDIREDPRTRIPFSFAIEKDHGTDGANPSYNTFANPWDSERIAVLRRFHAFSQESSAGPLDTYLWYNVAPQAIGSSSAVVKAVRLYFDYNGAGAVPTHRVEPVDTRVSSAGWQTTFTNGVLAGYIWRAPWFGTVIGASSWQYSEVLENFDNLTGPRIILLPGSGFAVGIADANATAYFNMWWDEYPLS